MKKIFWGLFFIAAAVFVVVNQLGYYTDINIFSLLFTILLIPIFVKSVFKLNFAGILFPLALFCIIYSEPLNLEVITPYPVLVAALLGSIGLSMIFNKHRTVTLHCYDKFDEITNTEDTDKINYSISFGSGIKYVNSDDFKTANLRCSFGAMKVYFDNAKMLDDKAVINLDVSFAGVEIFIPKEWGIINKVDSNLGGIEEKNKGSNIQKKKVILKGKVNLGGVDIFYV